MIRHGTLSPSATDMGLQLRVFTNGTLHRRVVLPTNCWRWAILSAISVEGYEKETDFRRGQGTFQRMMKAMEIISAESSFSGSAAIPARTWSS